MSSTTLASETYGTKADILTGTALCLRAIERFDGKIVVKLSHGTGVVRQGIFTTKQEARQAWKEYKALAAA